MTDFTIPGPGDPAPGFCLGGASGADVRLEDHLGRWVVLYFYPKDNTPGCTTEGAQFRDAYKAFRKAKAVVAACVWGVEWGRR